MAAVTVVKQRRDFAGARKAQEYKITGNSGDTLQTPFKNVTVVLVEPSEISSIAQSAGANGKTLLTFTASGAFTGRQLRVVATN